MADQNNAADGKPGSASPSAASNGAPPVTRTYTQAEVDDLFKARPAKNGRGGGNNNRASSNRRQGGHQGYHQDRGFHQSNNRGMRGGRGGAYNNQTYHYNQRASNRSGSVTNGHHTEFTQHYEEDIRSMPNAENQLPPPRAAVSDRLKSLTDSVSSSRLSELEKQVESLGKKVEELSSSAATSAKKQMEVNKDLWDMVVEKADRELVNDTLANMAATDSNKVFRVAKGSTHRPRRDNYDPLDSPPAEVRPPGASDRVQHVLINASVITASSSTRHYNRIQPGYTAGQGGHLSPGKESFRWLPDG
eukprot:gene14798-4387_t